MTTAAVGRGKQVIPRLGRVQGTSGYRVSPWVPYAFLVPAILLFSAFSLYPSYAFKPPAWFP